MGLNCASITGSWLYLCHHLYLSIALKIMELIESIQKRYSIKIISFESCWKIKADHCKHFWKKGELNVPPRGLFITFVIWIFFEFITLYSNDFTMRANSLGVALKNLVVIFVVFFVANIWNDLQQLMILALEILKVSMITEETIACCKTFYTEWIWFENYFQCFYCLSWTNKAKCIAHHETWLCLFETRSNSWKKKKKKQSQSEQKKKRNKKKGK